MQLDDDDDDDYDDDDDSGDVHCEQMLQSPTADQTEFNGRTNSGRRSKQNGSQSHQRSVPHIGQYSSSPVSRRHI